MLFRLSQKLTAKITAGTLKASPLHSSPLADWSAHLFITDRTQYILLTNTKTLYSTLCYGKGITNDAILIGRALDSIREFMEADGQALAYQQLIVPATASVRFAKALNRSVIGSMNDLIAHANVWLTQGGLSPQDVGFKLNSIPFSCLTGPDGRNYANPREVFHSLARSPDRQINRATTNRRFIQNL